MCNTATAKVARKVETKSIHVLLKREVVKNEYFMVRLIARVDSPPLPSLRSALSDFFGVCVTLDYEYVF